MSHQRLNVVTSFFLVRHVPGALSLAARPLGGPAAPAAFADMDPLARARQDEYVECIAANLACRHVGSVGLLVQDAPSLAALRAHVLPRLPPAARGRLVPMLHRAAPAQPTYGDLFRLAGQLFHGQPVMVANADIYVTDAGFQWPALAAEFFPDAKRPAAGASPSDAADSAGAPVALALTRTEDENTLFAPLIDDYRGSHDAFVFRAPMAPAVVAACDHPQNCYKAENIVVHELRRAGYRLANPCRRARVFHRHATDVRQWLPSAAGEEGSPAERYGRVEPEA